MFRALSTCGSHRRYERLGDEPTAGLLLEAKLKRVTSLPAKMFGSSTKFTPELTFPDKSQVKQAKKVTKSHPLFSLFDSTRRRRKKKTTARPEFARYLEYVKEGGLWDMNSNKPVIYYT